METKLNDPHKMDSIQKEEKEDKSYPKEKKILKPFRVC
jgi:hypothetical protein